VTALLRHPVLASRGHRLPATLDAIDRRNSLLIEIARRFCAGMSDRAAAAWLRTKLSRYRSGAWRRDATELVCPDRHRGIITEVLFCLLKTKDALPSERTIRSVLARTPRRT
jgi:hypothetical protein